MKHFVWLSTPVPVADLMPDRSGNVHEVVPDIHGSASWRLMSGLLQMLPAWDTASDRDVCRAQRPVAGHRSSEWVSLNVALIVDRGNEEEQTYLTVGCCDFWTVAGCERMLTICVVVQFSCTLSPPSTAPHSDAYCSTMNNDFVSSSSSSSSKSVCKPSKHESFCCLSPSERR